jgi:hypothetical protein
MARKPYPPAVMWLLGVTFAFAFVFLIIGSPNHRSDPLFWFVCLSVAALVVLSVMLHNEKCEDDRIGFIRVFFLGEWLLALMMAAYVVWKSVRAGTFW